MDNVTHSLVGLIVGEAAYEIRQYNEKPHSKNLRRYFLVASAFANNLPDIDIVYSGLLGELGYLLHHRGHTHTLIGAFFLALLFFAGFYYFAKFKKHAFEKSDWHWITALFLIGVTAHMWMDGLNSYGIHPFWPFYNGWLYGDSLFIVEPWLWLILSVGMLRLNANLFCKVLLGIIISAAVLLCVFTGFVPHEITAAMVVFSALLYFGLKYINDYRKTFTVLVLASLVILCFNRTSKYIRREFSKYYKAQYDTTSLSDLVLSPFPSNPFCWAVITVEMAEEKTHFYMRRGVLAAFPGFFSLEKCEGLGFVGGAGKFQADEKLPQVHWLGQTRTDLKVLKAAGTESCLAKEFLQFARTPYIIRENKLVTLMDLRFMRKNSSGFAQVVLVDNPRCLKVPAPWLPPRVKEFEEYSTAK